MTENFPPTVQFTYCPGCDNRVHPGQLVVGVGDDLWHQGCRRDALMAKAKVLDKMADIAIAEYRSGHAARMVETEETVKRNLAIEQERDSNRMRLDGLRKRAHAIDAVLLGQNENEGILDSNGLLHELPDTADGNAELNAIEELLLRLERAHSAAKSEIGGEG